MVDVDRACRTCMKSSDSVTLVDLFQTIKMEEGRSVELAQALMECTTMQVHQDDGLPQKVCNECLEILQVAYAFRNQALTAEAELRKLILADTKVKNEPSTELEITYDDSNGIDDYEILNEPKEEPQNYECVKCKKQYTNEKSYLKHLSNHENSLSCDICCRKFMKQSSLMKHLAKHTGQKSIECNGNDFDTSIIKTESVEDKFNCLECSMSFPTRRSLSMHKKKHKDKGTTFSTFSCDICKREYSSKGLLRRHIKIHLQGHRYSCPKCLKSYSRQDQLNTHMKKHDDVKLNVCTYCNKSFTQMCSLKDHLRVHTKETPYLCSQCGKGFKSHSNLRQHAMRHTGLKPYNCTLCPKNFATKGQMISHLGTHTNAHPYSCEQCGAAFTKLNSLKKHSLIHTGLRPFVCSECDMKFTCKDHLKRHQRIHTGEKPYKCSYCERAFTQSNDLIKHTRSHIGQNVYQCTVCNMKFRLYTELKQHYPTHYVDGETLTIPIGNSEYPIVINRAIPEPEDKPKSTSDFDRITIFNGNIIDKNAENGDIITINLNPEKT